jgi:acyl transferase domain-containing protein
MNDARSTLKRALLELRTLRAQVDAIEGRLHAPIAVVGMSLRLPGGVEDADGLEQLLWGGFDAIDDIPAGRWSMENLFDADPDAPGKMSTRFGGFLNGVDRFDAAFFGISPREAASMDPQQRLLLELVWESLENAAIAPDSLNGSRMGVYVGVGNVDYSRATFPNRELIDPYFATGACSSIAAGRISYTLGVTGPAATIDTACSSSLVALHMACQALRLGECDAALAGGVNLILTPEMNISFTKARMMAPDGRCKTFDAAADGYVRAEGCVVLMLKRERDARAAGDRILAVVRGSAINQDGRSNGITAPNGPSQEAVMRAALANSGVAAADVGYVEAHGTGTPLGDPIEMGALQAVYGQTGRILPVGSIKTNIGHAEAAAGLAGVAKAILVLQKASIPPSLHFKTGNPHIDWSAGVEVPTAARPFPRDARGRLVAGVSAFGFSGTNAHVILESSETIEIQGSAMERPAHVLALSAQTDEALRALAGRWKARFEAGDLAADLCHTANSGRAQLVCRAAIVGRQSQDFAAALDALAQGEPAPFVAMGEVGAAAPKVAFLFTGQGVHFAGMGRELYETSPAFREALDACAAAAAPYLDRDLLAAMFADDSMALEDPLVIQPACFALQIGLLALWRSWGVEPMAALGHSLGEYAAAYAGGIMSLEDAMRVVVVRGRGAALCAGRGAMVAVSAPRDVVDRGLAAMGNLEIAGHNAPQDFVVSGSPEAVAALAMFVQGEGGRAKVLPIPFGSHSRWVEPALPMLSAALAQTSFHPSGLALATNVSGRLAAADEMSKADYWLAQMRKPVRFAEGMEALSALGITHYLEIGPHPVLCAAGVECLGDQPKWLASMRRDSSAWTDLLEAVQRLFVDGMRIEWRGFDAGYCRQKLAAPTYPFKRTRHWIDVPGTAVKAAPASAIWARASAAAARQSGEGPLGLDAAAYPVRWALLERIALGQTAALLGNAGLYLGPESHDLEELAARTGIRAEYTDLLQRWLDRLAASGALVADGTMYSSRRALTVPALEAMWAEAQILFADNKGLFNYIRHCGRIMSDVVTGRESPLETLFPGGEFDLTQGLYERSQTMRYINGVAAAAVSAIGSEATWPLRVLEIGAGTGSTTQAIASTLPASAVYHFTDVSDLFVDRARLRFAAYPNMRYGRFDLDVPLADQGYGPGQYDLIVSANAVHACTDLAATLRNLRSLLAPGGVLALVEATTSFAWFDFTTSLIEGWRKHADGLRTDGPLMRPEVWRRALIEAGFADVGAWPEAGAPGDTLGQHLILAQVEGELGSRTAAADFGAVAAAPIALKAIAEVPRLDILAVPAAERAHAMRDFVRGEVMAVLRSDVNDVPARHVRFADLGMDSLMAVQLRNRLSRGLAMTKSLAASVMFDHPSIDAISTYLLDTLAPVAVETAPPPAASTAKALLPAEEVALMGDVDIEALLDARLEGRR